MPNVSYWKLTLAVGGVTLAASAHAGETISYSYDVHGRVTAVARTGTVNDGVSTAYTHDKVDNRTNVTVVGAADLMAAPAPLEASALSPTEPLPDAPLLEATEQLQTQSEPTPTTPSPGPS